MTEDEFLTLTLPERIKWCHGPDGPRGKLSHDRFAKILGTTRQTIIGWEGGKSEPSDKYRPKLAEFSGFPAAAFSRRAAEAPSAAAMAVRLEALEAAVASQGREMARSLRALVRAIERLERRLDDGVLAPDGARSRGRDAGPSVIG